MNKFSLSLAALPLVFAFACSDDKSSPSPAELCKGGTVTEKCIEGNWHLDAVYQSDGKTKSNDCPEPGNLKLEVGGTTGKYFTFTGGASGMGNSASWPEATGQWSLSDGNISVRHMIYEETHNATISISADGKTMTVTGANKAAFSLCSTDKTEIFTR